MANTQAEWLPFEWLSDEDQTYTDRYGDTRLASYSGQFDKACGKTFTMQAPGRTLALVPRNNFDATSVWGGGCTGLPTTMLVEDGTLQLGDENLVVTLAMSTTDLILQNTAFFKATLDTYQSGGGVLANRINLNDYSGIELSCDLYSNGGDLIQIRDSSRMKVSSTEMLVSGSQIAVSSQQPMGQPSLDLHIIGDGEIHPMELFGTSIMCSGSSKTSIDLPQGTALTLTKTVISADDASQVQIKVDAYAIDEENYADSDSSQFQLNGESSAIIFDSVTPGQAPFDFVKNVYPAGLFRFMNPGPNQPAMFLIRNCGNAFALNAMLEKNLVYVVGGPQNDRIKHEFSGGDLILQVLY